MTELELCQKIAGTLKDNIEQEFNTKVYSFGFVDKGDEKFTSLKPLGSLTPENAKHLFWFLVPLDDADNIITNDYYEKSKEAESGFSFSPSHRRAMNSFSSILREDIELVNFITSKIENHVYPTGSIKVNSYQPFDNIVDNAEKIEDLRYRYFRFYLPQML